VSNSDGELTTGKTPQHISAADAPLCSKCGRGEAGKDGRCTCCRMVALGAQRRKYPKPSPALLDELRLAYVGNVREVSANLTRISRRTGIPKDRLKYEANRRGWRSMSERRPWTPAEEEHLQESAGSMSVSRLARNLKRTRSSIENKLRELSLSSRLQEGYNISDLRQLFGTHNRKIEDWARRGLLGKPHGHGGHGGEIRFSEASIARFIRLHGDEYDLRRVDQAWFRDIVFGNVGKATLAGLGK